MEIEGASESPNLNRKIEGTIMTLKVAIVGVGNIGNIHGRVYHDHADVEIVAVCDIIHERSDKAAEKFGCQGFYSIQRISITQN